MASVLNTLYPPLIDTFMPAFKNNESGKVTFSLSPYNSANDIKRIHISLVNQKSNINAIAANKTASQLNDASNIINGIWIIDISDPNYIKRNKNTGIYTLTIPKTILKNKGNFSIDGYYKLQLRFDSSTTTIGSDYLISQRAYFSEWSSVCLLKAISAPTLALVNFDKKIDGSVIQETTIPEFTAGIIPIIGDVIFANNLSGKNAETLRSYQIKIYQTDDSINVLDSTDVIFTGDLVDPNHIHWLADCELAEPGTQYTVAITITTKNQYTETKKYQFVITNYDTTPLTPNWAFNKVNLERYNIVTDGKIITKEDGIVKCTLTIPQSLPPGWLYIKRASSLDNYKTWDLISCTAENGKITRTFEDATVGSLVRYRYSVQYQLKNGNFTKSYYSQDIIYPNFYDMLLSRDGRQLAIRYDAKVTSLQPIVNRQKIDTLGGKYPKFAENAQMNYKVFNISGYIDAESDFNRKFLSELNYPREMQNYNIEIGSTYEIRNDTIADETYSYKNSDDEQAIRTQRNTVHDLYPKDNWWLQREFREQAIQWLNDGEPKLFRSMPEGNMAVMLTDISLTPNPTVGRRVYSFSATMYEIEDGYSLDVLTSLGIYNPINDKLNYDDYDDIDDSFESIHVESVGQIYSQQLSTRPGSGASIIEGSMDNGKCGIKGFDYRHTSIEDFYEHIVYEENSSLGMKYNIIPNTLQVKDLQIEFESKPKWYKFDGERIILTSDTTINPQNDTFALGYKIRVTTIDGSADIFVNQKGFYQIPSNQRLIGLLIYDNAVATINYKVEYDIKYNMETIPSKVSFGRKIVGQISQQWLPNTFISPLLEKKYEQYEYDTQGQLIAEEGLDEWTSLSLELTPYTVVSMKFADENEYRDYLVGHTGILNLVDNYPINELVILGRRLIQAKEDDRPFLKEWEFVLDESAKINKNQKYTDIMWFDFIRKKIQETEQLVKIHDMTTTLAYEGINRYWNAPDEKPPFPPLDGYQFFSQVKEPQYNTVYGIQDENGEIKNYIYYIDHAWYPVQIFGEDQSVILAEVPVHGMINYRGNIVRQQF